MGYSPGSALGKKGSGRAEPVSLKIRRARAGISTEDPEVAKMSREGAKYKMNKRKKESDLMVAFGSHQKKLWKGGRVVVNFRKADAALVQLENREVKVEKKEEDDEEKEGEEEEEEITEEDLLNILAEAMKTTTRL